MITLLAFVVIGLILFLFYALLWSENSNSERGSIMSIVLFLITFIVLAYFVSRYLYTVALTVPTKIDILFHPIEKLIYKLIGTQLEHMSGKTYLKHFYGLTV